MKVFVCVPRIDREPNEIQADVDRLTELAKERFGINTEIVQNCFEGYGIIGNLFCFGDLLEKIKSCDVAFFANGWKDYSGCIIEYEFCKKRDIPCIDECIFIDGGEEQ